MERKLYVPICLSLSKTSLFQDHFIHKGAWKPHKLAWFIYMSTGVLLLKHILYSGPVLFWEDTDFSNKNHEFVLSLWVWVYEFVWACIWAPHHQRIPLKCGQNYLAERSVPVKRDYCTEIYRLSWIIHHIRGTTSLLYVTNPSIPSSDRHLMHSCLRETFEILDWCCTEVHAVATLAEVQWWSN